MIPLVKIITGFFSTGYALYCAKATMKGSKNLPKWDNWGDIFLKGLLARIIVLIYHLPVLLFGIFLIFSLGGMAILTELRQSPAMAVKTLLGLGTGILLMLCLAVLINYLVPSALMSYVDKNSFGAAFNLGNVFKNAFRGEYFITWLFFILYAVGIDITHKKLRENLTRLVFLDLLQK